MRDKRGIKLSQCMIVKNEEDNIVKALSWGKSVMWEQIVVDTGSTDRTVELAAQCGAKVFSFPWIDDFAAAKNYAIEQSGGDWIALLDADEYMTPEDAGKIQEILSGEQCARLDGIYMGWQQVDSEGRIHASGTQVRFFRNSPDIRYRRRIHEQLFSLSGRELRMGDAAASLSIFHTGYQSSEYIDKKKKNDRNLRLIQKELEDNPNDYEMMGYLGDEYLGDGDVPEAKKWYRRSIAHMPAVLPGADQRSAVTYTNLLRILTEDGGDAWEEAEEVYVQAAGHLPEEADVDYIAGRYFASAGETSKAIEYLERALYKLNTFGCANKALLLAANLLDAYELLARCCYEEGNREKCVAYAAACLKADKYVMSALSRLMMSLTPDLPSDAEQEQVYGQALTFFSGLYDFSQVKDRIFLVKTAERSGCGRFSAYVAGRLLTPEERKLFGRV